MIFGNDVALWIFWSLWIFWKTLLFSCHKFSCAYDRFLILARCHRFPCVDVRRTRSNRSGQVHHHWPVFRHNPVLFFLFLHPFRHAFGTANQAEILGTTERAEMADVEQIKKIVQFVTCEVSFGQDVCGLVFGVNVPDLNLGIQIDSVKQQIQSNSVSPWHMSHCGTPAFDYHFNHGFIVLKHTHNIAMDRKFDARRHVVNVKQFRTIVLGWSFGLVLLPCARHAMPQGSLCWWIFGFTRLVLVAMKHFNNQIPKIQAETPSIPRPASREIISASVELWETEVCFSHIQLLGTNVWLPKMYKIPPDVDFESSQSQVKSESWNNPNLHCCAVFPTCQYCFESTCVINVRGQTCWTLVACSRPFRDGTSKLVYWPQKYQVYHFERNTSIFRQFEHILLTILQQIPSLLLWIDGRQHMEFRLCAVVESFCLQVRNVSQRISSHDRPIS